MEKVQVAICGFGSRGAEAYGDFQRICPEQMEIVAVADPREDRRKLAMERYGVSMERCYASGEELLAAGKLAQVLVIATQDCDHIRFALPALELGYHLLLEKPISPDLKECLLLEKKAKECNRIVVVCHVLRYTQFYGKLKELLEAGTIGALESFYASENIAYWHFAHSYVRGNWRRSEESSPIILAKSCHDLDIFRWLVGRPCVRVSSFGSLSWFREENAPAGSTLRCLDCPVQAQCPYDSEKIYLETPKFGFRRGNTGWPCTVLCSEPTEEGLYQALRTGPYGRCVYRCDNDVADHQVVNMEFEGGVTGAFSMSAFTQNCHRTIRLMGALGELEGDLEENAITLRRFGREPERLELDRINESFSGHGGGDSRMMEYLCQLVRSGAQEALTGVEASVESHVMALAAEASRLQGGKVISLNQFRECAP